MNHPVNVVEATAENFPIPVVDNSNKEPVLVNFWSPRAGACVVMKNRLVTLAQEYQSVFLLVFVDIDAQTALASQLGIQSIPTTLLYQDGEVVETIRGPEPESVVRKIL
jgi:putative thioredoxin